MDVSGGTLIRNKVCDLNFWNMSVPVLPTFCHDLQLHFYRPVLVRPQKKDRGIAEGEAEKGKIERGTGRERNRNTKRET